MQYNRLGKAGIKVSRLSFGSWLTFGSNLDVKSARSCMRRAFERGVNFFDNAEVYGHGKSETIMGEVLKDFRREDLVVSTKIFWGGEGPNDTGLSRKHLLEGTKAALKRLQLDYVDLIFCHRPDFDTPVEETVRAMDSIVRSGMAFYWGTSEWPAQRIEEAYKIAGQLGCIPPSMEQPQYNLLARERVEKEYAPLYEHYGMGTTIWSPLASGILTGKYNNGIPPGSRLADQQWLREKLTPQVIELTNKLAKIAQLLDCSLSQLAIAWCLKNPNVSTVILGATTTAQLDENLDALAIVERLNDSIMNQIAQCL